MDLGCNAFTLVQNFSLSCEQLRRLCIGASGSASMAKKSGSGAARRSGKSGKSGKSGWSKTNQARKAAVATNKKKKSEVLLAGSERRYFESVWTQLMGIAKQAVFSNKMDVGRSGRSRAGRAGWFTVVAQIVSLGVMYRTSAGGFCRKGIVFV